jgi:hypothetical protein
MPTVAIVEGVKVQFFAQEHPPPHFHVMFAEHRAQIGIQPLRVLKGSLPPAKLAAVLLWAEQRQQALMDAWYTVLAKRKPKKIR